MNEETGGALDFDLMTSMGVRLVDAPALIGWGGILLFSRHLGPDSATFRARNPELCRFASDINRAEMLADLIDIAAWQLWSFAASRMPKGRRLDKPKPYPRPGQEPEEGERFGRDPIPIEDFNSWYYGGGDHGQ